MLKTRRKELVIKMKALIKGFSAALFAVLTTIMAIVVYYSQVLPESYYVSQNGSHTLNCLLHVTLESKEETVSAKHCVLFLYQGGVYLGDLNSRNGTWLRRGLRTRRVTGAVPVVSGDRLLIGGLSLRAEIFTMDMAYM